MSWDAILNNFSGARASLPTTGEARSFCCDLMNARASRISEVRVNPIRTWSHDMNIYADNYLAWSGPLQTLKFNRKLIEFTARDIFMVFERRYLSLHDRNLSTDLANIFNVLVEDALEEDPSPNIRVTAKPTGISMEMTMKKKDSPRAADLMRTVFSAGLDFTAIARTIYIGGVEILFPQVLKLWDPVCEMADLEERGGDLATRYRFTGELREQRVNESAGGVDSVFGLVEQHETDLNIKDAESAHAAALSRWEFLKTPPNYVSAQVNQDGPHLRQLIPGTRCDTRLSGQLLGCRDVKELMRLQRVSGQVQGKKSIIETTLTPLGRTSDA
jgi:hypothetical protein